MITNELINQLIEDAWLNIHVNEKTLYNPLEHIPIEFEEEPHLYILWLMQQPEYFSFICKEIFNIQLLPIQCVVLQELWYRKFPLFVAHRGHGKAVDPETPVRVQNGWKSIKNISPGDLVYGGNGKLTTVLDVTPVQHNLSFYHITFRSGRTIECCEDHQWSVYDKGRLVTLCTKQMVKNFFAIRKNKIGCKNRYIREYRYAVPINKPLLDEVSQEYKLHPYIVGVLLGDGCLTQNHIIIKSNDKYIIDKVSKLLPSGYIIRRIPSSKYGFSIVRSNKSVSPFHQLCKEIGIFGYRSHNKHIPEKYKYGSYEQKLELLKGLMDTDGCSSGNNVEFYTISNKLSDDVLDLVRSLGFNCQHSIKESWCNKQQYSDCNRIRIYTDQAVFSLPRKLKYTYHIKSKQGQSRYSKDFITNIEYVGKKDGVCISVDNDDKTYITKDYIVTHNSFLLALYSLLRIFLLPGRKVIIVGAAFRQSKVIFNYMEDIWSNAPILRDIAGAGSGPRHEPDMFRFIIGDSIASALPIGDGSRIRGQRANDIIADEFAAQSKDVFENVVAGFAAVKSGPIEGVRARASADMSKRLGIDFQQDKNIIKNNQIIISGTAYYDFNHFATYWKRWKSIIHSKGKMDKLSTIFGEDGIPDDFDWRDYSIIRLPVELTPKGFMDDAMVARSKATIHSGIFEMEFSACFSTDSNGFFKRSLIESCVPSKSNEITLPSGPVNFSAITKGSIGKKYVYGIDPASEVDNFSIVIVEHYMDHRRIVYVWTTNRKEHKERVRAGLAQETDFYSYCARKIRDLMKVFPCERIAMDAQGGGIAVIESLHDQDKIQDGELPIWPVINIDKRSDTDGEVGLHIVEMVNFSSAEWTAEANHGLRKDFEDRVCLFPYFDGLTIGLAEAVEDDATLYDTISDCILEIEELKNELSTIVITQTLNGRDRWDTPEVKLPGNKKGRLRKDRYSALVMANMVSRQLARNPEMSFITETGGFAAKTKGTSGKDYVGPAWLASGLTGVYD
jgi:hypothetical protein